jgi:hypothetical protein
MFSSYVLLRHMCMHKAKQTAIQLTASAAAATAPTVVAAVINTAAAISASSLSLSKCDGDPPLAVQFLIRDAVVVVIEPSASHDLQRSARQCYTCHWAITACTLAFSSSLIVHGCITAKGKVAHYAVASGSVVDVHLQAVALFLDVDHSIALHKCVRVCRVRDDTSRLMTSLQCRVHGCCMMLEASVIITAVQPLGLYTLTLSGAHPRSCGTRCMRLITMSMTALGKFSRLLSVHRPYLRGRLCEPHMPYSHAFSSV